MLEIVQVNVGIRASLGMWHGKEIFSAIDKQGLNTSTFTVTPEGIEGDEQVDRSVHGGQNKAIYTYPLEHLERWKSDLSVSGEPGTFGENLTVVGLTEQDVHIGDTHRWGGALLEVAGARRPCLKLRQHLDRPTVALAMMGNGRCGWYYRVLKPAVVARSARFEIVNTDSSQPTVAQVFAEKVKANPTVPGV